MIDTAHCGYEYSGLPKILNVAEHRRLREPRTPMRVLHETPVSARFDGFDNSGVNGRGAHFANACAICARGS